MDNPVFHNVKMHMAPYKVRAVAFILDFGEAVNGASNDVCIHFGRIEFMDPEDEKFFEGGLSNGVYVIEIDDAQHAFSGDECQKIIDNMLWSAEAVGGIPDKVQSFVLALQQTMASAKQTDKDTPHQNISWAQGSDARN